MEEMIMATKKIYNLPIIISLIFGFTISNAANYQTIASGNWSSASTWQGGNIPPNNASNDNITINAAHTVIMNNTLTFNTNCVLNVYGSLTVNNTFTVNSNFDLNVTGTLIINGNFSANANADVNITSTGTTSISGNATFGNNAGIVLNGNLNVNGALSGGANSNITGNGNLTVGSLSGFSVGTGITVGYLPVELLSFNCNFINNQTVIKWTTATETNNDFFTVERSIDGINFQSLGNIKGAGNSNRLINYEFIDKEIAAIQNDKIVYYRLKQTDYDSKISYSEIKAIHMINKTIQMQVFPNPATSSALYLSINNLPEDDITITLFDVTGKNIKQMHVSKDNISNTIDISSLINDTKGYYFVHVIAGNNTLAIKPLIVK